MRCSRSIRCSWRGDLFQARLRGFQIAYQRFNGFNRVCSIGTNGDFVKLFHAKQHQLDRAFGAYAFSGLGDFNITLKTLGQFNEAGRRARMQPLTHPDDSRAFHLCKPQIDV